MYVTYEREKVRVYVLWLSRIKIFILTTWILRNMLDVYIASLKENSAPVYTSECIRICETHEQYGHFFIHVLPLINWLKFDIFFFHVDAIFFHNISISTLIILVTIFKIKIQLKFIWKWLENKVVLICQNLFILERL